MILSYHFTKMAQNPHTLLVCQLKKKFSSIFFKLTMLIEHKILRRMVYFFFDLTLRKWYKIDFAVHFWEKKDFCYNSDFEVK